MSTMVTLKLMLGVETTVNRVRTRVKDGGTEILIFIDGEDKPIHIETMQPIEFVDVEVSHS